MSVLTQLDAASNGLLYSSESDRPFEPVVLPDPLPSSPLDEAYLRRVLQLPPSVRCEVRSIDDVLARHTHRTDPYDVETQRIRPRYEALQAVLEGALRESVAVRVGQVEVRLWLIGRVPTGGIAGVVTVAIET